MSRIVASFTMILGLAALMIGIYSSQWNMIQQLVRQFIPALP